MADLVPCRLHVYWSHGDVSDLAFQWCTELTCRAVQIRLLRAVCCILLQFESLLILTVEDWVEDWVEDKCQYCGTEMRAAIFHR